MRLGCRCRGGLQRSPGSQVGMPWRRPSGPEEVASLPGPSLGRSTCSGRANPAVNDSAVPWLSWARSLCMLCRMTPEQQGLPCCLLSLRKSP